MSARSVLAALLCLLLVTAPSVILTASASGGGQALANGAEGWSVTIDPDELEAFIDEQVADLSIAHHVMGTAVSVVQDGRTIFSKGYGHTDPAQEQKVSAADTLFRIGSISKTFTWTAVMQLVEQGRIDLDADVNNYLENFHLADAYGQPVTMRHLMTHTAGFEETNKGIVSDAAVDGTIEDYLWATMPDRVRAPGQWVSYSNHGTTLAALIIQDVSGMRYQDYIIENIFRPLGMANTSIHQPPAGVLADRVSGGFVYTEDGFVEEAFERLATVGAGEISTTAEDMTRFMLMHLQNGTYNGVRILDESTARYMHSAQFRVDPQASAFCLGFYQMNWRENLTIYGHGGDTQLFHSTMALFPEQGIGLFISTNTASGSNLAGTIPVLFVDHYFPAGERDLTPGPDALEHAKKVEGIYKDMRGGYTTLEKYLTVPVEWRMEATADGHLLIHRDGHTIEAVEVAPYRYALLNLPSTQMGDLLFILDGNGVPSHFVFTGIPVGGTYERLSVFQQQGTAGAALLIAEVLMLSSVAWIGAGLYRWRKGLRAIVPAQAALLAASAAGLAFVYLEGSMDMEALQYAWCYSLGALEPLSTYALLPVAVVLLLFAGMVLYLVATWQKRSAWSRWERAHAVLVMAGLVAFLWWAAFWNLL